MYELNLKNRRTLVDSVGQLDGFTLAVEVGASLGWYTKYILDNTNMQVTAIETEYQHCKKITESYEDRCRVFGENTLQASESFEDESIDFVYINSLPDSVLSNIEEWFPKIKTGGIVAGSGYRMSDNPGLVMAVEEFAEEQGLNVLETGTTGNARESMLGDIDEYDSDTPSWVIIKEE